MRFSNIDYAIPILLSILYFLAIKEAVPEGVYVFVAILAGFYHIPIKLIIDNTHNRDFTTRRRVESILINFNFYLVIGVSVFSLFLPESGFVKILEYIFTFTTLLSVAYFYITMKENLFFIICFLYLFLISGNSYIR